MCRERGGGGGGECVCVGGGGEQYFKETKIFRYTFTLSLRYTDVYYTPFNFLIWDF